MRNNLPSPLARTELVEVFVRELEEEVIKVAIAYFTGVAIEVGKVLAILGAGLVAGGVTVIGIAILAAPMGGWRLVKEHTFLHWFRSGFCVRFSYSSDAGRFSLATRGQLRWPPSPEFIK